MKNNKWLICMIALILCLNLSGCSSLLVRKDALITDRGTTPKTAATSSMTLIGSGILQDVSADGSRLLVFSASKTSPITYNIELHQKNADQWTVMNLLNSDKPHLSGVFSSDLSGIFYTETVNNGDNREDICQLCWTSLDRRTTVVLSNENESIDSSLCSMPDGKVLCANSSHQICIIDSEGYHENHAIDPDYELKTLNYDPVHDLIIFSADTQNSESTGLYIAERSSSELSPILIDQNIIDFYPNPETGSILYLKKDGDENQLILYTSNGGTRQIEHGDFTQALLNRDDSCILYTLPSDEQNTEYQMIEMMSVNGKAVYQLTSPRDLVSDLFLREEQLFFSVMPEDTDSSTLYDSTILSLKISTGN